MIIQAGDLRQRVTISKTQTTGQGTRGQDITSTVTVGTDIPARIEPLSGRKADIAHQQIPTATHEITIRYLAGVTPQCVVTFGSRTFNVDQVRNVMETSFALTLIVTEKQ